MTRSARTFLLVAAVLLAASSAAQAGAIFQATWTWNENPPSRKPYYYKLVTLPCGARQYAILYEQNPSWIYWYNPTSRKFWCQCPTIHHPKWGERIRDGEELFLTATAPDECVWQAEFPCRPQENQFTSGLVKGANGVELDLRGFPADLPD